MEISYCVHRNKNQQITWHIGEAKALCSFLHYAISDSTLYNISYVLAVLGQAAQSNLNKIFILQKRAFRQINFAPSKSHAFHLSDFYNVLPLNFLYIKSICIIVHDVFLITKHPVISPVYLLSPLTHIIITLDFLRLALSPYKIRAHSRLLSPSRFFCSGAKAWNCIPLNIRSLSKHKFKAAIHRQLLDILLFEDDYVDTLTITSRFKQL